MITILVLLVKRHGMSDEEFRKHYETSHSQLGLKYFGHLFLEYRRYYIKAMSPFREGPEGNNLAPQRSFGCAYDAIGEMVLQDEHSLQEMIRILEDPEIRRILAEDEARFLDREACRMGAVDVVQSKAYIQWPGRRTLSGA
jgi:hypothetical protein